MLCNCMVALDETVKQDEEGFVICPHHLVRRYGWIDANGRDHSKDGWTDLQVERWQLYGEAPVLDTFQPYVGVDFRDNRDPKYVTPHSGYEGSYDASESLVMTVERQDAATDARVRLDLRDKTDLPLHEVEEMQKVS